MTDTHHTLTEAERKLLEDCPREARYFGTVEQDEREKEIERRIGLMLYDPYSISQFEKREAEGRCTILLDGGGLPVDFAAQFGDSWPSAFPVPASRIRAALDAKRAADHIGEPNELTKAKEAGDMQDKGPYVVVPCIREPGMEDQYQVRFQVGDDDVVVSCFWCDKEEPGTYTQPEARQLAEAEAASLNAKWREEQAAREAEAEKQRRIAAFVKTYKDSNGWFWVEPWKKQHVLYIDRLGICYLWKDAPANSEQYTRAELEAALRAAGVEEPLTDEQRTALEGWFRYYKNPNKWVIGPSHDVIYLRKDGTGWNPTPYYGNFGNDCDVRITKSQMENFKPMPIEEPVTISDELRARLEKRWDVAISVFMPCVDETLVDEDGNSNPNNGHRFTRQQARAFLREKGIEVAT